MNFAALDEYLRRERARAAVSLALDEELGVHHGISASDFVLLQSIDEGATAVADSDLARQLGLLRSQLLMRVRPLEKVGLVLRTTDERGRRTLLLSAGGRRVVREARETAAEVCRTSGAEDHPRSRSS